MIEDKERRKSAIFWQLGPKLGVSTLVGQTVGDYRIKEYLGSGYSGDVYSAMSSGERESEREGLVALKFYKAWHLEDPVQRDRINREFSAASNIKHPNLVKAFDLAKYDIRGIEVIALVMEFLNILPLDEWIKAHWANNRHATIAEAKRLGLQILSALGALHGCQPPLIHRDLKPANIGVTKHAQIKVMDLGLVKPSIKNDKVSFGVEFLGTPRYSAPEILFNGETSVKSDLYSVGAVMYELLYCLPPFWNDLSTASLVLKVANEMPEFSISKLLGAFVEKNPRGTFPISPLWSQANETSRGALILGIRALLSKTPEGRLFQSCDEFAEFLMNLEHSPNLRNLVIPRIGMAGAPYGKLLKEYNCEPYLGEMTKVISGQLTEGELSQFVGLADENLMTELLALRASLFSPLTSLLLLPAVPPASEASWISGRFGILNSELRLAFAKMMTERTFEFWRQDPDLQYWKDKPNEPGSWDVLGWLIEYEKDDKTRALLESQRKILVDKLLTGMKE